MTTKNGSIILGGRTCELETRVPRWRRVEITVGVPTQGYPQRLSQGNPLIEDEATDRLHRIAQTKTLFVHHIQTSDTLEEKIAGLQERKRGLSDRIMEAADGPMKWTSEDLLELLRPLQ